MLKPSDLPSNNPSAETELRKITEEWQNRMKSMFERYGIPGSEPFLDIAFKGQRKLLERDQNNYAKSLCSLEKHTEKYLQKLQRRKSVRQHPPVSRIVSDTTNEPLIKLMNTNENKIPLTKRSEKVEDVLSCLDLHEHFLTLKGIVNQLRKFEDFASQLPEREYEEYMLKAKEAVEKRIRKI
ncbi:hypothetical protein OSTOST_18414 [Ostertagia ostertagi]